ncbi:MAG: hypothetical protein GY798_00780 [Hyphomicrobiales bacterium]|nr:hypothetical protein [Hyphomicrobiales bacterium]
MAFDERTPYADSIRHGYPRLRAEAERLRATGVPVYDLSDLFDELEAEAFRDSCCHYTDFGQEALAGAIAEIAASAVSATGTPLSTP